MAQKLPYENFRFDFRGNGDSEGTTGFGNIDVSNQLYFRV
jgi:alpha/beta superfamily hydrolase